MHLEITPNLVRKTLKAIKSVDEIPAIWSRSYLLKNESRDKPYALELLIKHVIKDNLSFWRGQANIPDNYQIQVNHSLSQDHYIKPNELTTALKNDIGDRGVVADLKPWSMLYHRYFVDHPLKPRQIAALTDYTDRRLRTYLNDGIEYLAQYLEKLEADAYDKAQDIDKLVPQTVYEHRAQTLVDQAQNSLDQGLFEIALAECDQAITYADTHDALLPFIAAHAVKAYTLLQGWSDSVFEAVTLLDDLDMRLAMTCFTDDLTETHAMTMSKIQRAFVSKRLGKATKGVQIAIEATEWAEPLRKINPKVASNAHYVLAVLYWAIGQYDNALNACAEAIHIAEANPNRISKPMDVHDFSAYCHIGLIYWSQCRYSEAEYSIKKTLNDVTAYQHHWLMAYQQGNLGIVYLSQGKFRDAKRAMQRQLELAQEHKLTKEFTRARSNLAILMMYDQGRFLEAKHLLEQSLCDSQKSHRVEGLCTIYANLSQIHTQLGEHKQALILANRALQVTEEKLDNVPPARIITLRSLAGCEEAESSMRYQALEEALSLAKSTKRGFDEGACLFGLAFLTTDTHRKRELWQQGVAIFRRIGADGWLKTLNSNTFPHLLLSK